MRRIGRPGRMHRIAAAALLALISQSVLAHGPNRHGAAVLPTKAQPGAVAAVPGSTGKQLRRDPAQADSAASQAALASQRFCMKNQHGKVHCIPFGAAH